MGRPAKERESRVGKIEEGRRRIQSTAEHVEFRGKKGGPPSKPKYYLMTDRGEVPRGKGEKNPKYGSEKNLKPYVYKHSKHVKVR